MNRLPLIASALIVAALAGCGSSTSVTSTSAAPAGAAATSQSTPAAPAPAQPGGPEKDLAQKPAIQKPSGAAPTTLKVRDIVTGKGPAAKAGQSVSVQYVGVTYSTGSEFDASWNRGQPFQFQLGAGSVIPGWDKGVVGMKVGGRRQLIIPPALAYGAQGSPPTIGPNETLIFDIDLKKIG